MSTEHCYLQRFGEVVTVHFLCGRYLILTSFCSIRSVMKKYHTSTWRVFFPNKYFQFLSTIMELELSRKCNVQRTPDILSLSPMISDSAEILKLILCLIDLLSEASFTNDIIPLECTFRSVCTLYATSIHHQMVSIDSTSRVRLIPCVALM